MPKLRQAQEILGLSYRQILRIKKRFSALGFEGLLREKPNTPSALKISFQLRQEVVNLRESLYWDFNMLHFKGKLEQHHRISLSYESIRRILIKEGLHE